MSDIVPVYGQTAALVVEDYIDKVWWNGQNAYETAMELLNSLAALAQEFNPVTVDVDWTDIDEPQIPTIVGDLPVKPTLDDIPAPPITFSYSEIPYVSNILEALKTKLLNDLVNGGTGLSADVEQQIYDRESERDEQELNDTLERFASRWSEFGWSLPDGVLYAGMTWAEIEYQNKRLDKSRKIAEDSFEIAVENTRFTTEKSVSLEQILMTYNSESNKNRLEAAKAILEAGIQIFEALIKEKLAKVELYKSEAEAYKAQADALGSIAKVQVSVYEAKTQYNIGKATVAAKQIELQIEQLKLQLLLQSDITKGIVSVASTLAAGAMSAINAGAHVGYSGSESISSSSSSNVSSSISTSYNHNYQE